MLCSRSISSPAVVVSGRSKRMVLTKFANSRFSRSPSTMNKGHSGEDIRLASLRRFDIEYLTRSIVLFSGHLGAGSFLLLNIDWLGN